MLIQASLEALLALELFQLNPSAKKSRALLNQHLVEVAMFEHEDARALQEIDAAVLDVLEHATVFSHDECKEALRGCVAIGRISQLGNDSYILAEQTKIKLSENIEKLKEAEKQFDRGLTESIGRKLNKVLNPFAELFLCATVKEVIQGIFYQNALKLRRLLDGECDFSVLLEVNSDAESELRQRLETFLSLQSDATVEETIEGIQWFLGNLNQAQKHYIASLHHKVFYFQILNLDPRLQKLEEECFRVTRLYLDTNVVVWYLCESAPRHEPIVEVLNTSKARGVKLFVSPKTLQESERLVREAEGFSRYLNNPRVGAALLLSPIAMSNPIIEAFLEKRRKNPSLNWAAFLSPFKHLEIYLMTNDIEVSDDKCGDILADDSYPRVRGAITDAKGEETHPDIIEHDAYNLVLVQKLRGIYKGTPLLGSSVWLITIDKKLPRVDRMLQSRYPNPHCRLIEQWGAVLLPFQNVGSFMATDEYISYLVSQRLGAAFPEEVLDIHFFEELEKSEVELESILRMDPEIAFKCLADLQEDREARTLLEHIRSIPDEEKEPVKSEFHERALAIISKRKTEDLEQDKREIARLQNGIEELSRELHKMELATVTEAEKIELLKQKLETTKRELKQYESMSFWQRVKYVLRGRGK